MVNPPKHLAASVPGGFLKLLFVGRVVNLDFLNVGTMFLIIKCYAGWTFTARGEKSDRLRSNKPRKRLGFRNPNDVFFWEQENALYS